MTDWTSYIFSDETSFTQKAKKVFEHQLENNAVYRRYCKALDSEIKQSVEDDVEAIPLLPIRAFKDADVTSGQDVEPDLTFKSSGTSSMQRSVHQVVDKELYHQSLLQGFRHFYDLDDAVVFGYTPGYSENPHSSLIYMIRELIETDRSGLSRFLPLDEPLPMDAIKEVKKQGRQLILFGAAFGLLDLLEMEQVNLPSNSIIIETGGMKTHRREVSKKELHQELADGFGLDDSRIRSEYGMAELLSQAYTTGGQWFKTVPWMQLSIRNPDDPTQELSAYKEGLIGVMDLANVHSCSFILTGDKGMMDREGRVKVLGRWNPKDLRGCNFLIDED